MPETYKKLYSKFLQTNIPINYTNEIDIIKDPLTLSLLVDEQMLNNFLIKNKNSKIVELYNNYIDNKDNIIVIENKYIESVSLLGSRKNKLNEYFNKIKPQLTNYKNNNTTLNKDDISNLNKITKKIFDNKISYMSEIYKIIDILLDIYKLQNIYFINLINLLVEIKKEYINIIQYYKEPELAIRCIDYDINLFQSIIQEDINNPYSKSYFDNLNKFTQFHLSLTNIKDSILNPQINYKDEYDKYILNPDILSIEQTQYQIYSYKIFLYYSYNQMDIWNNYYNSIELFVKQISIYSTEILNKSESLLLQYNTSYTEKEQLEFINNNKIIGVRAEKNNNKLNWFVVDKEGNKIFKNINNKNILNSKIINSKKNNTINSNLIQQEKYIKLLQSQTDAYDCVILYIYLLEIQCLRQSKLYTAEENINQLNIEYSTSLKEYYSLIYNSIENFQNTNTNNKIYIPKSLLWDTTNFSDINYINSRIELNNKSWIIYKNRITELHRQQNELDAECDNIIQLINPNISQDGFIKQCNNLFTSNYQFITPYTSKSSYWLNLQINNYDIKHTNEFIYNINDIVQDAYYDGIIKTNKPNGFQDWLVYDNIGGGDCLFASLVDALNGQLDLVNATTTNQYTEEINGKKRYTINSLRRIVADNFPQDVYELYCLVMPNSTIDSSNNCLFDTTTLDPSNLPDDLRGIYNLLVDENKNIRNIEEVKKLISSDCSSIKGGCYWADHIAINILQNILKIKFIIFNMTPRLTNNIYEGDKIIYKDDEYRVKDITRKKLYDTSGVVIGENPIYIIENDIGDIIMDINPDEVEQIPDDTRNRIRIDCTSTEETINFEDFVYILRVNISSNINNPVYHYEFVRNMFSKNYILKFEDIPDYIQYFIYDNCYRYVKLNARQNTGFSNILKFNDKFLLFDKQLQEDRFNLKKDIQLEEAEILADKLTQEEIQTSEELALLKLDKNISQKEIVEKEDKLNNVQKHLKKVLKDIDLLSTNQTNKQNKKIVGGEPIIIQQFNPDLLTKYKQNEGESKFSYYVNIELELFPGTSINSLQKSTVKCQTRFEKIREAYADLFGYEYRPGVLKEAYNYQSLPITEETSYLKKTGGKNKKYTIKKNKNTRKNMKTRKNNKYFI